MGELISLILKFATVAVAIIGGCFAFWKWHKRPFKQDRDRYRKVMDNITPFDIYYFRDEDPSYHKFSSDRFDNIWASAMALRDLSNCAPKFIDKELLRKEQKLIDALGKMSNLMTIKTCFNGSRLTIYPIDYEITNPEHTKGVKEVKKELDKALNCLIEAFEDFRDSGHRKFAERLPEQAASTDNPQ